MSVLTAQDLSKKNPKAIKLVHGYLREQQQNLTSALADTHDAANSYYTISDLIIHFCLSYYCLPELRFDAENKGAKIVMVSEKRIKFPDQSTNCCLCKPVISLKDHGYVEWTLVIHQYSKNTYFGFVDCSKSPPAEACDVNRHITSQMKKQENIVCNGLEDGWTRLQKYERTANSQIVHISPSCNGDRWKFMVDAKTREVVIYHNEKSLGVMWKNIFEKFVFVVSNSYYPAEYEIESWI